VLTLRNSWGPKYIENVDLSFVPRLKKLKKEEEEEEERIRPLGMN